MNDRPTQNTEIPAELDFSKAARGLHHIHESRLADERQNRTTAPTCMKRWLCEGVVYWPKPGLLMLRFTSRKAWWLKTL